MADEEHWLQAGAEYQIYTPLGDNSEAAQTLSELLKRMAQEQDDTFEDLVVAAQSSLDFWDNPLDNEDWTLASVVAQ